jgi:hypothetical protein
VRCSYWLVILTCVTGFIFIDITHTTKHILVYSSQHPRSCSIDGQWKLVVRRLARVPSCSLHCLPICTQVIREPYSCEWAARGEGNVWKHVAKLLLTACGVDTGQVVKHLGIRKADLHVLLKCSTQRIAGVCNCCVQVMFQLL